MFCFLLHIISDLGFSEFQIGKDHPDYIMSQHRYMNLAMKKPRFSHLRKILKKKSNQDNQRTNVTSTAIEEEPGDQAEEPVAED